MREPHIVIDHANGLNAALLWIRDMAARGLAAGPVVVKLGRQKRSEEQSRKFWATMGDLAAQVDWYGQKLTKEEWRTVLTAGLRKQKAVPGLEGGFVVLGESTARMTKGEMTELIDLAVTFGESKGVTWHEV